MEIARKMECAVPDCGYRAYRLADCSFVRLPENEILRERWLQAIQLGSGLSVAADCSSPGSDVVCSEHFEDKTLLGYQEPSLFLDRKGKPSEVCSCRICLNFYHRHEMVSTNGKLRKRKISVLVQKILGITLMKEDFLQKVCEECLVKLDICLQWIKLAKKAEAQYQELVTAAEPAKECFRKSSVDNAGLVEGNSRELLNQDFCTDEFVEITKQEGTLAFEIDLDPEVEDVEDFDVKMEFMEIQSDQSLGEDPTKRKRGRTRTRPLPEPTKRKQGRPRKDLPPDTKRKSKKAKEIKQKRDYKDILSRNCYICDKLVSTHAELIGHLTSDHAAKVDYICQKCPGKTFTRVTTYNHHLSFHDTEFRPIKCDYCSLGFTTLFSLKVHQNREHETAHATPKANRRTTGKVHQCDSCGKTFRNNYQLLEHDNYYHKKIYDSVCAVCGKAFPTKTLLKKHHIVHSGERPYKCDWCDEMYKNSTSLTRHVLKHKNGSLKEQM